MILEREHGIDDILKWDPVSMRRTGRRKGSVSGWFSILLPRGSLTKVPDSNVC